MENPFRYGGVVRGEYFADRGSELEDLEKEMVSLGRVFLVSPRRYGKTCLLFNLADRLRERGVAAVNIDLNAYPDLRGLAAAVAGETARALESSTDKLIKLISDFKYLRPRITAGQDGSVSVGVEAPASDSDPLKALLEALEHADNLAGKKGKKLVVVIDEFSDLEKYDGQTLEKALRSEIQKHENVGYILSGSEQTVMLSMVRDRGRAFYRLGRIMKLGPIPREAYRGFISGWLEKGGFRLEAAVIDRIFDLGQDVPYNVQRLCHTLWELLREKKEAALELVDKLPGIIVRQDSPHYEMIWQTATQAQRNLMIVLSSEFVLTPFSKEFMLKYGIGPASSIRASLESLVKKGILYKSSDGRYIFADTFMPHWIGYLRRNGS